MEYSNEVKAKIGSYDGKAEMKYSEEENRFSFMAVKENTVASSFAGAMFGLLGRLLVSSLTSSASGKELGSFKPEEITQVKFSSTDYHVQYYFYCVNKPLPYDVKIESDTYLNVVIKKLFADKMVEIIAR